MSKNNFKNLSLIEIYKYIKNIFYITLDTDENGTVESITRSTEFHGVTVWTLIFAVFIASIGLNTNSTAIIIGAMLISPLMGPVMGSGLSLGIYDFDLLKKSIRNLAVMTIICVVTSSIYFFISPLTDAKSELLSRTYPTIYDVLIAIFGGATGIIAGSRKDRISNAIPGVAIATALMPPLCTAGYAIAIGNINYFLGALYLYIINSVFIGLSTFVFVKYLKFKKKSNLELNFEKKFHFYILIFSFVIVIPSVFMAYDVISEASFRKNANLYIEKNFNFENSKVVSTNFKRANDKNVIEISIIGEPLSNEMISYLKLLLSQYNLSDVNLKIIQYGDKEYKENQNLTKSEDIKSKDEKILFLENELRSIKNKDRVIKMVVREINILFPSVESISFGDLAIHNTTDFSTIKDLTVLIKWKNLNNYKIDKKRLELFLKSRLEMDNLNVLDVK